MGTGEGPHENGFASREGSFHTMSVYSAEVDPARAAEEFRAGGQGNLRRCLERRNILMIAMSGTVGIGLFLNSSKVLALAGSAGALIAYIIVGIIVTCVMFSLAEMVSFLPISGAIYEYPKRFVDPALGFSVGWMYWMVYASGGATLSTSAAMLSRYWEYDFGLGTVIFLIIFLLFVSNILGVRFYGELEYGVGITKVLLTTGLIILMFCINRGAGNEADPPVDTPKVHGVDYWKKEYRFPTGFDNDPDLQGTLGQFLAIWTSITMASFAYIGIELVIITAGEARFPTRDLPKASRRMYVYALVFYIFGMLFVSLCVPYTHPRLLHRGNDIYSKTTPFSTPAYIIAIQEAHIRFLPGFINALFLFCAATAGMTALYASSRTLYAITRDSSLAPLRIFGKTDSRGVPYYAVLASWSIALFAFLQVSGTKTIAPKVLDVFSRVGTTSCLIVWGCQCLAFLRFFYGQKYQTSILNRRNRHTYSGYRSSPQPLAAYVGLIACSIIVFFNGWEGFYKIHKRNKYGAEETGITKGDIAQELISAYLGPLLFVALYAGNKILYGTRRVPLNEIRYLETRPDWEEPWDEDGRPGWKRFLSWIF